MFEPGLFDVPDDAYLIPPAPEKPARAERRNRLVANRIQTGWHPLGYVLMHPDASKDRDAGGPRCGGCRFRVVTSYHNKSYPKCRLPVQRGDTTTYPRDTGCESSDIRAWWPACVDYQPAVPA